jgi:hypothetical protein
MPSSTWRRNCPLPSFRAVCCTEKLGRIMQNIVVCPLLFDHPGIRYVPSGLCWLPTVMVQRPWGARWERVDSTGRYRR